MMRYICFCVQAKRCKQTNKDLSVTITGVHGQAVYSSLYQRLIRRGIGYCDNF